MANTQLQSEINALIKDLQKLDPYMKTAAQEDMTKAAGLLVSAIKGRAPESEQSHKRYATSKVIKGIRAPKGFGQVVATYQPGNLKKSFRTLKFRRSPAVFVGPKVGTAKADGYYAHWVEFGTENQRPKMFVQQAVAAVGSTVLRLVTELLGKRIDNYAASAYKKRPSSWSGKYARAKGRE